MIRTLRRLSLVFVTSAAILGLTALPPDASGNAGAPRTASAAATQATMLPVPRADGMTIGYAGTSQPEALVAAQPYAVRSLATFDVATQRWRTYVPGAPSFANTLTSANLTPDSIVFAKRTDATSLLWSPPRFAGPPVVPLPESANTLTPPPPDGLTLGVAGTSDPGALAAVQLFDVLTINAWDVAQQRYDTYIPGAPDIVNTLTPQTLAASDFVWIKANGGPTGALLHEDVPIVASLVAPGLGYTVPAIGPAELGKLIDLGNGRFSYVPPENYFGLDTFSYTHRGDDGLEQLTFKLIILPVNDAPVAEADVAFAKPNLLTIIDVLSNDTDVEEDDLSILSTTQPLGGIVSVADGVLTYTPFPGFTGVDEFTYEVSDGIAKPGSSPDSIGTVSVIVTGALTNIPVFGGGGGIGPIAGPPPADDGSGGDTPPFLTDDEIYLEVCSGLTTISVLANDAGDGSALTIASVGTPILGTASNADGSVAYTPPVDCTGDDSFTYTVIDSSDVEHTANVTVHLGQADPAAGDGSGDPGAGDPPANQLPNAVDDAVTTFETTPVTIDLLANDSDPDSDPIAITAITDPDYGTLVDNGDGTVTYTAPDYYGGAVNFTYTITDGVTGESTATVTVTVERGAVSARLPIVVYAGGSVTVQVVTPSDSVQLDSVTEGSHGTVTMNAAAGTFTYQPFAGFVGSDWISWTLLFSFGGTAETTVQIDIIN